MHRSVSTGLALTAAFTWLAAGEVRAQVAYGYGYGSYPGGYVGYGWGGWGGGGTIGGDMARGLGAYYTGAGTYNLDTAEAASINVDTVMRWNQYTFLSQQEANIRAHRRIAERMNHDASYADAIQTRLRDNPTQDDITSGNALNVVLDQISDPRIHTSSLRLATAKIPGKLVRTIPFVNASEAISISLDQLTAQDSWPVALKDSRFDEDRHAYSDAVNKVLAEDEEGEISPSSIQNLRAILGRIKAKLTGSPPVDPAQKGEAYLYLKSLYGMTRMLEKPQVEKIIAEVDKVKETSLGSLLGFMHTFNLRFGKPSTPQQREAYEELYPLMVAHRDRVMKDLKDDPKALARSKTDRPTEFFQGMHLDHLEGK